jgi:hypothetical protein
MPVVLVVSVPLIFLFKKRKRNYEIKEKREIENGEDHPSTLGKS